MFKFFSKKPPVSLGHFVSAIRDGKRDFFSILEVSESSFETASPQALLDNPIDVAAGVRQVKMRFTSNFFEIFPACLVKYYDSGDVKFVFYVVTKDVTKIASVLQVLNDKLGRGMSAPDRFNNINDIDQVRLLANDHYSSTLDLAHYWSFQNVSFVVQYRVDPYQQFSMLVNVGRQESEETITSRSGSVHDLFSFKPASIVEQLDTEKCSLTYGVDRQEHFVDYVFPLSTQELGIFNQLTIRRFLDESSDNFSPAYNLFFKCTGSPTSKDVDLVVKDLVHVYGRDSLGLGSLSYAEADGLEKDEFWSGRMWSLNADHIKHREGEGSAAYHIMLGYDPLEGLELSILGLTINTRP